MDASRTPAHTHTGTHTFNMDHPLLSECTHLWTLRPFQSTEAKTPGEKTMGAEKT